MDPSPVSFNHLPPASSLPTPTPAPMSAPLPTPCSLHSPGANDGTFNLSSPNAPRSLVLYDDASTSPFACCDLAPQGALNTDWPKKLASAPGVKKCEGAETEMADSHASGGHHG